MSMPVEVDWECPKTLLLRSPWYRFPSQSYKYFRYPSAMLEFLGEGSVGWGWYIHQWKKLSPKHGYSHWDCVDICFPVSGAKFLVLPVWGWVLFLLPVCTWCCSPNSDNVGTGGIGHVRKLCCSRWRHVVISSRHQLITTSGFSPPSWIYKCSKCQIRLAWVRRNKNNWNLVCSWQSTWHTAGVVRV